MKIRTIAAALTAAVMTAAMTVTAFAAAVPSGRSLPEFRYTNDAPYMNTILDYVKKTDGQYYDAGDVMIPNFIVLKADESDPQDVKVWGNFWTMNYDLQGDNLFTKNGGEVSGLIHLTKTPAGYEVTGFDKVGDGSSYTPDMNRIFGVDLERLPESGCGERSEPCGHDQEICHAAWSEYQNLPGLRMGQGPAFLNSPLLQRLGAICSGALVLYVLKLVTLFLLRRGYNDDVME